ncbi:(2Fe-2S) ferredoxin domain-containing protein [Streptomyces sp. NPDC088921]|uniref:(2Fe-2S) ferredoxin domain-containing protein n=1 Tax=unclassified Streptomyces TaxID=2593676 RepID=UPI00343524FE
MGRESARGRLWCGSIRLVPAGRGEQLLGRRVGELTVNDPDATDDIAAWIAAGGPGLADPPGVLDLYAFAPSRRVRQAVDD